MDRTHKGLPAWATPLTLPSPNWSQLADLMCVDMFSRKLGQEFSRDAFPHLHGDTLCIPEVVMRYMRHVKAPSFEERYRHSAALSCISRMGGHIDTNFARCTVMTFLTVDAVLEARKRQPDKQLVVLECGGGTGILSVAALLTDPNSKAVIYEISPEAVTMMKEVFHELDLSHRVEIREDRYCNLLLDSAADVVISENMNHLLRNEAQLFSMFKARECTHERSVFAPGGFDVLVQENGTGEIHTLGRIRLADLTAAPCTFDHQILSDPTLTQFHIFIELLNYDERRVYIQPNDGALRGLFLGGQIGPLPVPHYGSSNMKRPYLRALFPVDFAHPEWIKNQESQFRIWSAESNS